MKIKVDQAKAWESPELNLTGFKPTHEHMLIAIGIATGVIWDRSDEDASEAEKFNELLDSINFSSDCLEFGKIAIAKGSFDIKREFYDYLGSKYSKERNHDRIYVYFCYVFHLANKVIEDNFN